MDPQASHDEVKRAYLERALRFHPDRVEDRSAESLERAEFRTREINTAWAVLRSPAARARYDDELSSVLVASTSVATWRTVPDNERAPVRLRRIYRESPIEDDGPEIIDLTDLDFGDDPRRANDATRLNLPRFMPTVMGAVMLSAVIAVGAYAMNRDRAGPKLNTVEVVNTSANPGD